tara:strand:- start:642 stop:917 length:276 start_codon:yes stop_codon:yes gene_type:complete
MREDKHRHKKERSLKRSKQPPSRSTWNARANPRPLPLGLQHPPWCAAEELCQTEEDFPEEEVQPNHETATQTSPLQKKAEERRWRSKTSDV